MSDDNYFLIGLLVSIFSTYRFDFEGTFAIYENASGERVTMGVLLCVFLIFIPLAWPLVLAGLLISAVLY